MLSSAIVSLISPSIANLLSPDDAWSTWSYFPLTTLMALPKKRIFGNPKYSVKNKALQTKRMITNGAPSKTSKNIIPEMKSEIGLNA